MNLTTFTLRRLSFGALCIEGDCNQPARSEKMGTLDIDGDMPRVAEACGLAPGDVVVDAGGFVGDTAVALAQSGAEVYAFEPFLDAFVCLLYNTRRYKVHAMNRPTGNGEHVYFVYECPGPNYGMRRVVPCEPDGDSVQTFRIDDLNLPACKLMKIDVEGSEIPTLLGAVETIKRCRPFLFVEMFADGLAQRGYTPEQLAQTINDLGYQMVMWGEPPRWDWFCRPL